jgi:hypothetical protein
LKAYKNQETELRWFGNALTEEYRSLNSLMVLVFSDWHFGNPYCSEKHIDRAINFVLAHPNCRIFLNGDLCETVTRVSKGDVYNQIGTPDDQKKWIVAKLMPIKKQILGMTTGNHENRTYELAGTDISDYIAEKLEVPYRPFGLLYKLSFGSNCEGHKDQPYVFWSYITHGYGGARTKGSKAIKVERTATFIHADWYAMSHDHVVNVAPDVYLEHDNRGTVDSETGFISGKVTAHRKLLIKTNAYVKWGGYAESSGFNPSDLTTPLIHLLTSNSKEWSDLVESPRKAVKVTV